MVSGDLEHPATTSSNAALSGELNDVLLALNLSPLVHSDRDAEQLATEMILAHEKWLPIFAATIEKLKFNRR